MQKYAWIKSDVFIHPASSTMMKSWEQIREKPLLTLLGTCGGNKTPITTQKNTFKNLGIYRNLGICKFLCINASKGNMHILLHSSSSSSS
jgi:hypothetical protein